MIDMNKTFLVIRQWAEWFNCDCISKSAIFRGIFLDTLIQNHSFWRSMNMLTWNQSHVKRRILNVWYKSHWYLCLLLSYQSLRIGRLFLEKICGCGTDNSSIFRILRLSIFPLNSPRFGNTAGFYLVVKKGSKYQRLLLCIIWRTMFSIENIFFKFCNALFLFSRPDPPDLQNLMIPLKVQALSGSFERW